MNSFWYLIIGFIVALAIIIPLMMVKMRARKLSGASLKRVQQAWAHVEQLQDPVRKVLEADKVLDIALGELGYTGSVADKLKKAGPRLKNLQAVWDAHKLRNQLAHESGKSVDVAQADRAVRVLKNAIDSLS